MTDRRVRICVHCVLARVLRAEAPALARAGLSIGVRPGPPVLLPHAPVLVYRELRDLLREAAAGALGPTVRLALVDLAGRHCVEVTASVRSARGTRIFSRTFARHVDGTLEGGFLEGLAEA
jgi:hypothetical protein